MTTVLYRPVGQREYDLIAGAAFRRFPPLPDQPFFNPATNEQDATRTARDWNTKDEASGWTGYVLRFRVMTEFLQNYPIRMQEYWIPAEDLEAFNHEIEGKIEVVACYRRR